MVERAVNDLLLGPDWAVNIEVCDYVARKGDIGAKQVCKALRSKLQGSDPKLLLLALTLAETMMQNGNPQTYEYVGSKYVLAEMERYAQKSKADRAVREKILALVQAWAEAFRTQPVRDPRFVNFTGAHDRLRNVRPALNFPPLETDVVPTLNMRRLPMTTPSGRLAAMQQHDEDLDPEMLEAIRISAALDAEERRASMGQRPPPGQAPGQGYGQHRGHPHGNDGIPVGYPAPGQPMGGARPGGPPPRPPPPPPPADPQQLKKDLQVAASTIETFGEVLAGIPEAEAAQALGEEFVEEMLATVKELGPRLVRLIEDPNQDEEVLMTSLAVNDSLQTVMGKYDALVARHTPRGGQGGGEEANPSSSGGNLIDGLDGPDMASSAGPALSSASASASTGGAAPAPGPREPALPSGVAPPPTAKSPMTIKWQGVAHKALNVTAVASPGPSGPGSTGAAAPLAPPPSGSSPTQRTTPLSAPAPLAPPPGSIRGARSSRSSGPASTDLADLLGDMGPPSTAGTPPAEEQRKAATLPSRSAAAAAQDKDIFDLDVLNEPEPSRPMPPPQQQQQPRPQPQPQQTSYTNGGSLI